jgi:putative intracellular protease/amidase
MKPKAYLLVFDGLADWEPALAMCEINKTGKFDVVCVGFTNQPIITMGGLKIVPDTDLGKVEPANASIFIMPGGNMWESGVRGELIELLQRLHREKVPIGAICAATLEIARAGLTRNTRHTSNSKEYLKSLAPDYHDEEFYVDELAVMENGILTASGLGSVEFGREVIKQLKIHSETDVQIWFDMFKHGALPSGLGQK